MDGTRLMSTDDISLDNNAYYQRVGDGCYLPTIHAQGAWNAHEQHMAPISGLMTQELAAFEPRDDLQIGRISFEILGLIPLERSEIHVERIRPGRTIELIEATLTIGGRAIIRARAWRLSVQDTSPWAGIELPSMPPVEESRPDGEFGIWPGGYIASLELRTPEAGRPGRRRGWVRTEHALIEGERTHPLADYVARVDAANGLATRLNPRDLMYPNVDLTIHLLRQPDPAWVGLDTSVSFGATGLGITTSVLHDVHGVVGHAAQCLTVREFPAGS